MSKSAKKRKRQQRAKQLEAAQSRKIVPITEHRRFDAGMVDRLTQSWTSAPSNINNELYHNLRTMRSRSRDLYKNNEYGRHFFRTLVSNVVGPNGVTFQSHARDARGQLDQLDNERIEQRMTQWSRKGQCDVTRKFTRPILERLYVLSLAMDGEAIFRKHTPFSNEQLFALEHIDPELLDIDHNVPARNGLGRIVMGVEVDEFWAPVAYHFLTQHPSPFLTPQRNPERIRIPANEIIHDFIPMYANQVRGMPWIHAGMRALRQLGGYREAAVVASRVGANKLAFWRSQDGQSAPIDGQDGTGDAFMDSEPGEMREISSDVDLLSWDPNYPHEQFGDFNEHMLRGLSGAFGMAYFTLNNDLKTVNLSSARIGQQNERDEYRFVQHFMIDSWHLNWFPDWLTMQIPMMGLPMTRFDKFNSPSWQPRTWPSPDPLKDAQTNELNLNLHVTSPQRVIRSMGQDPEEVMTEIAQWNEMLTQAGINTAPQEATQETEDDEQGSEEAETEE